MGEILTIRLSSEPNDSIPWLVWSPAQQSTIASGETTDLHELAQHAKEKEVILLADSAAITLTSVQVPAGSERQLETVLPFLLEDEIAQDVMQVHVALLQKREDTAHVAIIEHQQMQYWLSSLAEYDIHPRRVVPDCLCLPQQESGYSAAFFHDKWLLRTGETTGGAIEESWLSIWLSGMQVNESALEDDEMPQILSFAGLPQHQTQPWHLEEANHLFMLLAQGAIQSSFNLLSGRYKPQNQFSKHLKPWRAPIILGLLLFMVWGVESVVNIYQTEKQTAIYKAQISKEVKEMFPNNRRIPTTSFMKRLFDDEIRRLSGSNTKVSYLAWIAEIAPLIKEINSIELDAIRFDQARGELRLNMRGKDFADFEKLREVFSKKYKTDLGQLNRNDSQVTGAFVLERDAS